MHVIIGAGIAGCYIAMQLKERNESFVLLEASEKPHSKIETTKEGTASLEMGASIFHSQQPNLMRFLRYLNMDNLMFPIGDGQTKFVTTVNNPEAKLKDLFKRLEAASRRPTLLTLREVAKEIFSHQEYRELKTLYNIWYEVKNMNAYVFFTTPEAPYMMLKGGLKNVIKTAWKVFESELQTNQRVDEVTYDGRTFTVQTPTQTLTTEHLYVCISPEQLPSIKWNQLQQQIDQVSNLVTVYSSIRYYIILNKPVEGISNRYTVGDIIGHWWIQVSPSIYMLYTDAEKADQLNQVSDDEIVKNWIKEFNAVYGQSLTPSDVKRTIRGYWKTAYEVLKPEYYVAHVDLPFILTSIPQPMGQAWMEGHLFNLRLFSEHKGKE